jgi:hypothetical protein
MQERKVWELGYIVCRILGLIFDEKELTRIFKKLELNNDCRSLSAARKHGLLVHLCSTENKASRHMDKILKKRFEPYRSRLKEMDQRELCRLIESGEGLDGVPLSVLIWFAVREDNEEIEDIDLRVFDAIHMREHQALRFYDYLSRTLPHYRPEDMVAELEGALNANKTLKTKCERLDSKTKGLRREIEVLEKDNSEADLALMEQRKLNGRLKKELDISGSGLALEQIESRDKEIESLRKEVKHLTMRSMKQDQLHQTAVKPRDYRSGRIKIGADRSEPPGRTEEEKADPPPSLEGIGVAFVGGKDSLIPHYRETVESFGGVFHSHCGKSSNGKKEMQRLVNKVDIVFCPVDINSHYACQCIKKACKLRNKPCCFLRKSGLNTFRQALVEFVLAAGSPETFNETGNLNIN